MQNAWDKASISLTRCFLLFNRVFQGTRKHVKKALNIADSYSKAAEVLTIGADGVWREYVGMEIATMPVKAL